jgi:hypothetical protein
MNESKGPGYTGSVAAGAVAGIILAGVLVNSTVLAIVFAGLIAGLIARGTLRGTIAGLVSGIIMAIVVIVFSVLGSTAFGAFSSITSYSSLVSSDLSLISYLTGLGKTAMYVRIAVFGIGFCALGGFVGGSLLPNPAATDSEEA